MFTVCVLVEQTFWLTNIGVLHDYHDSTVQIVLFGDACDFQKNLSKPIGPGQKFSAQAGDRRKRWPQRCRIS